MATITTSETTAETQSDQLVALEGIDWAGYAAMLRLRGGRSLPRMTYLDGRLSLGSPSYRHETLKKLLDYFIASALAGLGVPFLPAGSTTFRRKRKRGGVEGDETYYLANRALIQGKAVIDLRIDPPPDLAVEVVVTHDADDAIEVYRRLGVPEVWICTPTEIVMLTLGEDGRYAKTEASIAVPGVSAIEVHSWINRPMEAGVTAWADEVRRWAAEVVAKRPRGPAT
ncbi:Uma2 family endonuclease [Paludisphaera rhizosphaerae]|uniref:Uma2 family endonuclease n=1 Tax=Paludisphaera rhizosphaerae TaxID=2711216 RepID=UPI0013EA05BA|nr:Uma2 family endonuclease [Paludisphaera rhizosphaerae]